jgi:Protein of unknown function (DUF3074)
MATAHPPIDLTVTPFETFPKHDAAKRDLILAYVLDSVRKVRGSREWKKGKSFNHGKDTTTESIYQKSDLKGNDGKVGWHGRVSVSLHQSSPDNRFPIEMIEPLQVHEEIKFSNFRQGLLIDHATTEPKYIHGIKETTKIDALFDTIAEVWRNACEHVLEESARERRSHSPVVLSADKLPIVTKDRDFLEMLITVDLPAHPDPLSVEHEGVIEEYFKSSFPSSTQKDCPPKPSAGEYRSFLVIQVPVTHHDAPERPAQYIRGKYASIEAVSERSETVTEWRMVTQSSPEGSIPAFVTERAMPGKIAEDVPAYVKWAKSEGIGA